MLHSETHIRSDDSQWIVFVHGAGGNISTWKYQIPYFREHYNLLFFDLRGHGKSISRDLEKPYTFDSIAEDIKELIDHYHIEEAYFLGLSIGSLIIHNFEKRYPGCVKKIVATGGIYQITWQIHYFSLSAHALARIFPYNFLYVLFAFIVMPKRNHKISRKIFIRASKNLVKREYIRWLNLYGTFRETVENIDFSTQKIPTLIVMGEEDHLFLKPAADFAGLYQEVQLDIIPGSGHICNIEKPELYNQIVHKFLNN